MRALRWPRAASRGSIFPPPAAHSGSPDTRAFLADGGHRVPSAASSPRPSLLLPPHRRGVPACALPPAPRCGAPAARAPTLLPAERGACLLHPEPRQRRNRFQINQQMSSFLQTNFRILCRILFKTLGSHFALLYYLLFQFHYIFS